MRFLHCADVHLGGPNAQERMHVFHRMLDFCAQNEVQLLLIAGDLFDAAKADARVKKEAFDALQRHPELSVLIAAGNHDPDAPGGNYDGGLPENVYVFGREWSCVEIPELNVRVWGASFTDEKEPAFAPGRRRMNLTAGLYEVGVLHGDLVSARAKSDYRAVTAEAVEQTGLAYLALGHIHARSEVLRAGQTYYAYSGCLQGAGFDEPGEKGAYLGNLDEDGLEISFVRLCGSMCLEETLDVTGCSDLTDMAQRFCERVDMPRGQRVRLTLTGKRCGDAVDTAALERLLAKQGMQVLVQDETSAAVDFDAVAGENTLRGAFVRRMLDRIAALEKTGGDAECVRLALQYGLAAFEGEVKTDAD